MEGPKRKYIMLLPLAYNVGKAVPPEVMDAILDEIFVFAGGYSIAGTVQGAYRMHDGSKQLDDSLQIWIGIYEEEISTLKGHTSIVSSEAFNPDGTLIS